MTGTLNLVVDRPWIQAVGPAMLASAFAIVAVVSDIGDSGSDPDLLSFLFIAAAGMALLLRGWSPVGVLGIVVVARLALAWNSDHDVALIPAAMIALYTVARTGDRRSSLIIGAGAAAVMMFVVASVSNDEFVHEFGGEAALMLLPLAVGDAARSRADRLQDLIDTEATARVQAERIRIARDLHDVVAHGLSTIAIQSGVAAHLLDRDPGQARESLEIINATGKQALDELRAMVGVLRATDDDAPLRPTPSDPNDLSDLLAGAAELGLTVSADVEGEFPPDVGDACVVATHRIIQEALTNVARHAGPVAVDLSIHHAADRVGVRVTNGAGKSSLSGVVPSTGVGIIGMAERAEALGGSIRTAQTASGGFIVDAMIPYTGALDSSESS